MEQLFAIAVNWVNKQVENVDQAVAKAPETIDKAVHDLDRLIVWLSS